MKLNKQKKEQLKSELVFSFTRSSGPGGQHVNKVNTRVELRFSVSNSQVLTDTQKQLVLSHLKNRINAKNELILVAASERSQWRNKEKALELFYQLLNKTFTPVKRRIKTKPTLSSKTKRLESKKLLSQKKQLRKSPDF